MTAQSESEWEFEEIAEVAERQTQILGMILLYLAVTFISFATPLATPAIVILLIVMGIIQSYVIFKLAQAVHSSAAWLYIILIFIPLIGLIALVTVNEKATTVLRAYGVKVGLMGARLSDLEKIKTGRERCALPSLAIEAACNNDWADARRMIDETVARSQGLASAEDLLARLYLGTGLQKQEAGDADGAAGDLRNGWESAGASDAVRFKIASAINEAGRYSEACDMFSEFLLPERDKDLARRARKLIKAIRKRNRLKIRCPNCERTLSGTTDMIGEEAVCTRCKTEFTISRDLGPS